MKFSNKAYKYLDKLSRDQEFVIPDKQLIIDHLKSQHIQPFAKIIEFQSAFSGLELTITNKPGSAFKAGLFSRKDIRMKRPASILEAEGEFYFYFGEHATAQFWFLISSEGKIATYIQHNETVNTIFSSFEKFIETYAFCDLLAQQHKYEHPYYYNVINTNSFEELTQNFFRHTTANDNYNKWLSNGTLVIDISQCFSGTGPLLHIYGEEKKQCEDFIEMLKQKQTIA
jgi:hypothetical protein